MKLKTGKPMWLEYLETIIIALALALFIRTFIVQAFKIPSGSMLETLQIGDHLLVNKFLYGVKIPFTDKYLFQWKDPQIGDIVVFKFPDDPSQDFIKRIVGTPGDVLEMRNKVLYRNGQPVKEPYLNLSDKMDPPLDNFAPITVPEGKYFAMGDNRDASHDSRRWNHPFLDRSAIHGKAWRIFWSWKEPGFGVRWDRIGQLIQ